MMENIYSTQKIAYHPEILQEMKDGKQPYPIQIHLMPDNRCNHRCIFCSYRMDGNKNTQLFDRSSSIPADVMSKLLSDFSKMGGKAIELSVRGDEIIPIIKNDFLEINKISDFVDSYLQHKGTKRIHGIESFSLFDKYLKDEITTVFKHPCKEDLLKITLESGRNITVTKSHSLCAWNGKKIVEEKVSNLKKGDYLVLKNGRSKKKLPEYIPYDLSKFDKRKMIDIRPDFLKIDSDFCRMLGYFVAEGTYLYNKHKEKKVIKGITFTFGYSKRKILAAIDIAKYFGRFTKSVHLYKYDNKLQLTVDKKWVAELFMEINTGYSAKIKRVPNIIFNLSDKCKIEFLRGYYIGDGNFRNTITRKCNRNQLCCKTASKILQQTLSFLLDTLGIFHTVNCEKVKKRKIENRCLPEGLAYTVSISGKNELIRLKTIIESMNCVLKYKDSKYSHSFRAIKSAAVNKDAYALKIKRIENISNTNEMVYDISIGQSHRFISSFNILCHNTGGGEPLIYPFKRQMFSDIIKYGFDYALVTNGTLLDEDLAKMIAPRMMWARVSIDAGDPATYGVIRGTSESHYRKAIYAVEMLRKFSENPDFRLGVGFVVNNHNYSEIYDACRIAKESGADNVRISAVFHRDGLDYFEDKTLSEGSELAKKAECLNSDTFKVYNLFDERIGNVKGGRQDYKYCGIKELLCVVGGNCDVYTCCSLAFNKKGRIGNIKEQGFKELWDSEEKHRLFEGFDASKVCGYCLYEARNKWINRMLDVGHFHRPIGNTLHKNFI